MKLKALSGISPALVCSFCRVGLYLATISRVQLSDWAHLMRACLLLLLSRIKYPVPWYIRTGRFFATAPSREILRTYGRFAWICFHLQIVFEEQGCPAYLSL